MKSGYSAAFPKTLSILVVLFSLINLINVHGQNLVINPSAESPINIGWTSIKGVWIQQKKSDYYANPQDGKYMFFAGQGIVGDVMELNQDVDVSSYSEIINAGNQQFIFSAYVQCYKQDPPDTSQIILEALSSNKKVLKKYNLGKQASIDTWSKVTDTFTLVTQANFIRIRLISIQANGSDSDGYFDNISLSPIPYDFESKDLIVYQFITPNEDEINDNFKIENIDLAPINKLYIYNYQGDLVYHVNNYQNGIFDASVLADGNYYYIFITNDISLKGRVVIQR